MSTPSTPKRLRKDAVRNQELVLDAAGRVFSARGLDAPLEDIASEAGLGVGTVHRAFGSKAALIDALFTARLDRVVALIDECAMAPTGWEALRRTLWALTELQIHDRAMRELLYQSTDEAARQLRARIEPRLTAITVQAKNEGRLRPDFAATDIAILSRAVSGTADLSTQGLDLARRHIGLLFKGLAATPDDDNIPGPLTDDDFPEWLAATQTR